VSATVSVSPSVGRCGQVRAGMCLPSRKFVAGCTAVLHSRIEKRRPVPQDLIVIGYFASNSAAHCVTTCFVSRFLSLIYGINDFNA
jgi:hypothetical protein